MATVYKQPIIGVVPSYDDGRIIPAGGGEVERIYLRHEYTKTLTAVGAVPIILNHNVPLEAIIELCDGIVISGGEDIDPAMYGEEPIDELRITEPKLRFDWEKKLINACDQHDVPILGICYGYERLNVHYGGTLIQDIPTYMPVNAGHDMTHHEVRFEHDFLGINANSVHITNSRHHQAIDRLADGFKVTAVANDGIIEAIEGHGHYGILWHPESDETGAHLYRSFIEACKKD